MKQFKVYKDIRMQAMIMGLPLVLFALLMTSIIIALIVIIFCFSLSVIVSVVFFNLGLYIFLIQVLNKKMSFSLNRVFPDQISIKHINEITYETSKPNGV